jgi:hypothetical protein
MQNMCMKNSRNHERHQAAGSVRKQVERAREKWVDVERRIRQRMRIYPTKLRGMITSRAGQGRDIDESDVRLPAGGSEPSRDPEMDQPRRKPIVSIHGRDLEETESELPLAS